MIELAAGNFARTLGTASGDVQFTSNGGGFAAVNANRTLNLSNSATLNFGGAGSFMPSGGTLILGTPSADSTLNFQNSLILGSGTQTVTVNPSSANAAAVNGQLSGTLSGSGGLLINGGGDLQLSASNTYTGITDVSESYLQLTNTAALPSASNLTLDGGVVELAAGNSAAPGRRVRARCSLPATAAVLQPWGGTAPSASARAVRRP